MYREHTPTGRWRHHLICTWSSVTPVQRVSRPVVPDGCVDLLWSSTDGLVVVGAMTRPAWPAFPAGTEHVALRLRPGHAPPLLGLPASAVTDLTVPAGEVLGPAGRRLSERLDVAECTTERLRLLQLLPELAPRAKVDGTALAALRWLVARPGRQVAGAADHVGLSPRQLQRRVTAAVGFGPKRVQRVVRVQQVLAAGRLARGDLARLAAELGFADQAHLTREVEELAGRTPHVALTHGRATLLSETFKRADAALAQDA